MIDLPLPLNIMIVENSPEDIERYRRFLEPEIGDSSNIITFETGKDGLAQFRQGKPDCILLDFNLPDMDGLEFIEELSNSGEDVPTAVIMLTGQGDEKTAVEAMKRGAQDYLVKNSLSQESMIRAINNAVEKVSLRRELVQVHKELEFLALRDPLTKLANRNLFRDRFEQALREGKRSEETVALLLVDLDGFKEINDTLGHLAGDLLLQEVAGRLTASIRESDTVSRLGGDEFTVILRNIENVYDVEEVARKILESLSAPVNILDEEVFVSGSVGAALYPDDAGTVEELLKNAGIAMYRAKEKGRNNCCFFTKEMNERISKRNEMKGDLQRALENREFRLYYQPIINMETGLISAAEVLMRWPHPRRGMIPPDEFIPLAEETGLIVPMGEWMLRTVCEQVKHLNKNQFPPFRVAINISARQCQCPGFPDVVGRILDESGVNPEWLIFEITETAIVNEEEQNLGTLRQLRNMGIHLSIDDFGTGFSSLSYLKRFPVDAIKIDRFFMRDVPSDPESRALVKAIVAMAESLNLSVVAEGIETESQLDFLRLLKCNYGQGFLFSKAVPFEEFQKMSQSNMIPKISGSSTRSSTVSRRRQAEKLFRRSVAGSLKVPSL